MLKSNNQRAHFHFSPRLLLKRLGQLGRLIVLIILLLSLRTETLPPDKAIDLHLAALTSGQRFNWVAWEFRAVTEEAIWWLQGRPLVPDDPPGADQKSAKAETAAPEDLHKAEILAFLARQQEIVGLEDHIRDIYAKLPQDKAEVPDTSPPPTLHALETDLETLYQKQKVVTPQAERILAAQIGQVLVAEGFGRREQVWPPVTFRINELPTYLIISQRDKISQYRSLYLLPDMPAGDRTKLEERIEAALDVSALVDNVGGIGSWPAMISDPLYLPSLLDVIAHEWCHNYLQFYPLGQSYSTGRDLTTMNETVASIVGEEVAHLTLARFYPEQLPPPRPETEPSERPEQTEANQTPRAEEDPPPPPEEETYFEAMRRIRLRVDELLAAGKIEEAEAYMEAERQKLVARGHGLRKLNQAYFAFHGSYATSPASVDPIGPWLRQLRAQNDSLKSFLDQVSQMESLDDLLVAVGEKE